MKATIRLFKAVPIDKKGASELNPDLLKETIANGFLLSPEVVFNYSRDIKYLISQISEEFGLSGEKMNATFHKTWQKIIKADCVQLIMEQLIHYLTTYGFQSLGIYSDESIYIPCEKLNVPEIDIDGFRFVVIKGYTKTELKQKIFDLLESGIALSEDTIQNIVDISIFVGIKEEDIEKIKNKEIKIFFYEYLNIIPQNPTEFLRYAVYKSTESTLLIKNRELFNKINSQKNFNAISLFSSYKNKYGFEKLAEIFNRFKPIFLSFRTNSQMRQYINKIKRLTKKYHKPMEIDYLNNITQYLKNGCLDIEKLNSELEKVNIFRKIRLAYALKFRTTNPESILYRIRNNKSYATEFNFKEKEKTERILKIVINSICVDIKENVKSKKIYIPDNITYALPSTEKQFVGNVPSGTYISIKDNLIAGIHWENVNHFAIDLDLSVISLKVGKIGWNTRYRSRKRDVLFSGDITSAPKPKGASELFFIQNDNIDEFVMFVNYFNFNSSIEVPFKIIIGQKNRETDDFMINPNEAESIVKTNLNTKQKILGFIISDSKERKFYFVETNIGANNISHSNTPYTKHTISYFKKYYKNTLNLNEMIKNSGGIIINNEKDCDINLSIEKLEKDTIINLLRKK